MPTINFFEWDPAQPGGLPNTVGATYTFDPSVFENVGTADITDSDVRLNDDESDGAVADVTFSDGSQVFGNDVDLEEVVVVSYVDPDSGATVNLRIGRFEVEDVDGSNDFYGMIANGPFPPPGTEVTVEAFISSPGNGMRYDRILAEVVCFARGTKIRTPDGERPIEDLREGDLVTTMDGTPKPIRWIGSRTVAATGSFAPVVFESGAIGNQRQLVVSPAHRMLISGWRADVLFGEPEVLIPARQLTHLDEVYVREGGEVEYFHMLFDTHEIVFAEGAPSESFLPSEVALSGLEEAARDEVLAIFPELGEGAHPVSARIAANSSETSVLEKIVA